MPLPRLSKNLPSRKFRREEKCERKPSGCPFAFNHPPRRQNCKIKCYNILFCNSGSSLAKKARRDFFDKLGSGQPGPAHCCRSEQAVDKTGKAKGLSLRGGRRPTWQSRGTCRIIGKPSAKSQLPSRDCTPRALPRASRSGRHGPFGASQ